MKIIFIILMITLVTACANVSVTKTVDGFYEPTNPSLVQILKTLPDRTYVELGTVTASGFDSKDVAKMHNALRNKSATLGANAVLLTDEGLVPQGFGSYQRWGTGVAIVYTDEE